MAVRRISAETLIELAVAALTTEVMPGLAPDRRYAAAMITNALHIARREIASEGEAAQWTLLDALYDDGNGTMQLLATDIRAGRITERTTPGLRSKLRAVVVSELKIRNPRFLEGRPRAAPAGEAV